MLSRRKRTPQPASAAGAAGGVLLACCWFPKQPKTRQHQLCRAAELDAAKQQSALYAPEQRILAQVGESCCCGCIDLFRVQLHQDSSYTSHVASYGRWRYGSALGSFGLGSGYERLHRGWRFGTMRPVVVLVSKQRTQVLSGAVRVSIQPEATFHKTGRRGLDCCLALDILAKRNPKVAHYPELGRGAALESC